MRGARTIVGLLVLAAAAGCKSELRITVSQYQGELILSQASQVARIEAMARTSFDSIAAYLSKGFSLLKELKEENADGDGVVIREDRIQAQTTVRKLVIELALASVSQEQREALLRALGPYEAILESAGKEAPAAKTTEAASASGGPQSMPDLDEALRDAASDLIYGPGGADAAWSEGLSQETAREIATRCARFAELMQALQRNIELIDDDVLRYIKDYYYVQDDKKKAKENDAYWKRTKRLFTKGGTDKEVEDYFEVFIDLWMTLEENYYRISGLSNFILQRSGISLDDEDLRPPAAYRAENWRRLLETEKALLARLQADLGRLQENGASTGQLVGHLALVKETRRRVEELQAAYIGIDSAGAYLGLEQVAEFIRFQERPGQLVKSWVPITHVRVKAGANANYVVMRDHLGNWQVKAARNDATELVDAIYGSALGVIELASQGGSVSRNLKDAYADFTKKVGEQRVVPYGMRNLLDNLRAAHQRDVDEINGGTQTDAEKDAALREVHQAYADILSEMDAALTSAGSETGEGGT